MQGGNKTFKAADISWNYQFSRVLLSAFKRTPPANPNCSIKNMMLSRGQDGSSGGLPPTALKTGKERGEGKTPDSLWIKKKQRSNVNLRGHLRGVVTGRSSLLWNKHSFLVTNDLLPSATVLFHIKISKTITSCIGTGASTRCDEVSIVLLSAWKILLMVGVKGGLTDPNCPNSSGHISLSQTL